MDKAKCIEQFVNAVFLAIDDDKWKLRAISHSHAVSRFAVMLARRRGEDAELASIAGFLHDLYAYEKKSYTDHAHLGAERAAVLLKNLNILSESERMIVCSAIRNHDDLDRIDSPMDEILKDADPLDNALDKAADTLKPYERERLTSIYRELGMHRNLP
ncbi:MAG: HD domain-containing protein [Clostridia bacterium]|nr:HD domain-containing protein [Clostridia bacterium]